MNVLKGKYLDINKRSIFPNDRFIRIYERLNKSEKEEIKVLLSRFSDGESVAEVTVIEAIELDEEIAEKIRKYKGEF